MYVFMTVDGDVEPSDELIDDSIDIMLNLFKSKGYDCIITKAPEGDVPCSFIKVECDAPTWRDIENIARCVGGDDWAWVPILNFIQADEMWKQLEALGEV